MKAIKIKIELTKESPANCDYMCYVDHCQYAKLCAGLMYNIHKN